MPESVEVVYKRSRLERDLERYACSEGELLRVYRNWGLASERIRHSDHRQRQVRTRLGQLLPGAEFIAAERATRGNVKNAPLVIALGGDNHLQRVARLLDDEPLAGINSDPATSLGMLTGFDIQTFEQAIPDLLAGASTISKWARLEVCIDGRPLSQLALYEVFVGERDRCVMSRHVLHFRRQREEQESSGLLVVTGAGSMGWYLSAGNGFASVRHPLPKTSSAIRFLLTEPHSIPSKEHPSVHGRLRSGERLRIISLNRRNGVVALDSFHQQTVRCGAGIEIGVGRSLRVVVAPGTGALD